MEVRIVQKELHGETIFYVFYTCGEQDVRITHTRTEGEARAAAVGFQAGVNAVKSWIGIGPKFDGNIR